MSAYPIEADGDQQHPRQRASRACQMCHSRKVKCDALKIYPCTRCRDSNLQCTLRVSHRGKSRRHTRASNETGFNFQLSDQRNIPRPMASSRGIRRKTSSNSNSPPVINATSSSPVDLIRSLENFIENPHGPVDGENSVALVHATNNNALATVLNAASDNDDISRSNVHLYVRPSSPCSTMDRYHGALARLDPTTRDFLVAKRLFDLPEPRLADHLVQNFFEFADPHVPLIHKVDFLERYNAKIVPPLLMQTVLFIGSHFAEEAFVTASPWATRDQMTATFFEKAKLMADFEMESDQITLIQSFVLLSERWLGWTEERNTRYWTGRAVNVAYMMGLHRKIETLNLSLEQQRLWTRIAWVTMSRDSFVASSFGTPAIIDDRWTDGDALLWNATVFDESREGHESDYVPLRSADTVQYSLAIVSMGAMVKRVLHALYSWSRTSAEPITAAVLEELHRAMVRFTAGCPSMIDIELQDTSVIPKQHLIYKPLLRAAYALVSLLFYWPLAERHKDAAVRRQNRQLLHGAAHDVCEVMSYMRAQDLFKFCPVWLCSGVFYTMAVLLSDCHVALLGSSEPKKTNSFGRLRQLIDDLSILEETWKPAGWFRELIRISLSKLQEKVRRRKENQCRTPEPKYPPQQEATESADDTILFYDSPGTLFDSARELFPDLENTLGWNSAEVFTLG